MSAAQRTRTEWSDDARGAQHDVWCGEDGLRQLQEICRVDATDPSAFQLVRRCAWADDVLLIDWSISPLAGVWEREATADTATIVAVVAGRIRYWSPSGDGGAARGAALVVHGPGPVRFRVPRGARVIEIQIPSARLGPGIDDRFGGAVTPIPLTSTESVLLALAEYSLDPDVERDTAQQALAPLAVAILHRHFPDRNARSLRDQILAHIEERLRDPQLSPQSIAAAFEISVRWLHRVFDTGDDTVGRHIRRRRIELVADRLSRAPEPPTVTELAMSTGFASQDSLTRAFKRETGMTTRQFREARLAER